MQLCCFVLVFLLLALNAGDRPTNAEQPGKPRHPASSLDTLEERYDALMKKLNKAEESWRKADAAGRAKLEKEMKEDKKKMEDLEFARKIFLDKDSKRPVDPVDTRIQEILRAKPTFTVRDVEVDEKYSAAHRKVEHKAKKQFKQRANVLRLDGPEKSSRVEQPEKPKQPASFLDTLEERYDALMKKLNKAEESWRKADTAGRAKLEKEMKEDKKKMEDLEVARKIFLDKDSKRPVDPVDTRINNILFPKPSFTVRAVEVDEKYSAAHRKAEHKANTQFKQRANVLRLEGPEKSSRVEQPEKPRHPASFLDTLEERYDTLMKKLNKAEESWGKADAAGKAKLEKEMKEDQKKMEDLEFARKVFLDKDSKRPVDPVDTRIQEILRAKPTFTVRDVEVDEKYSAAYRKAEHKAKKQLKEQADAVPLLLTYPTKWERMRMYVIDTISDMWKRLRDNKSEGVESERLEKERRENRNYDRQFDIMETTSVKKKLAAAEEKSEKRLETKEKRWKELKAKKEMMASVQKNFGPKGL